MSAAKAGRSNGTRRRALHVVYALDFGGVEAHLAAIARTGSGRYEHCFCALTQGGAAAEAIREAGGNVIVLNARPWSRPITAVAKLVSAIRQLKPAVVHGHGAEGSLFGIPAALIARVSRRVAEEIGMPGHSLKARMAFRAVYRAAHRVIAVSDAVRAAIIRSGEADARKVVRLYNPVILPAELARARKPSEPLRIGFVGRLEAVKDPLSLVKAIALLPRLDAELIIVGEGTQREAIEEFTRSAGLERKVKLVGFQQQPAEWLGRCHLYVQPSRSEGFGIAVVEAMACGLPVIVSNAGGMGELVEDGINGWVISSTDPQSIASAIENAASLPPGELAAMGESGRSIRSRFEPSAYLKTLEDLYDGILPRRSGRSP